ncbi:MAG: cupin domain-containing protein [Pseudonocardiaceae bacterium]
MRHLQVLRDMLTVEAREALAWTDWQQPGRTGTQICPLYTCERGTDGPATAFLVAFGPGSRGDLHEHADHELMFVLDGVLQNDNGDSYTVGDLIIEDPWSTHQVSSRDGCVLLVVRQGPAVPVVGTPEPHAALAT